MSVIASVLAAGAALGLPALMESASGACACACVRVRMCVCLCVCACVCVYVCIYGFRPVEMT